MILLALLIFAIVRADDVDEDPYANLDYEYATRYMKGPKMKGSFGLPRFNTPYENGIVGSPELPPDLLEDCTEPIFEGIPDWRGVWEDQLSDNHVRISQCGDRLTFSNHRMIHDLLHVDGKPESGVWDIDGSLGCHEVDEHDLIPYMIPVPQLFAKWTSGIQMKIYNISKRGDLGASWTEQEDGTLLRNGDAIHKNSPLIMIYKRVPESKRLSQCEIFEEQTDKNGAKINSSSTANLRFLIPAAVFSFLLVGILCVYSKIKSWMCFHMFGRKYEFSISGDVEL